MNIATSQTIDEAQCPQDVACNVGPWTVSIEGTDVDVFFCEKPASSETVEDEEELDFDDILVDYFLSFKIELKENELKCICLKILSLLLDL